MNLWNLAVQSDAAISSFCPTLRDDYRCRLRELGFVEGERVRCLRQTPFGGPKVFQVGNTIYSLASDLARHVFLTVE